MTVVSCEKTQKPLADNPLTAEWNTPYEVPPFDIVESRHYEPALEYAMAVHSAEIDAIVRNNDEPAFENVILAYDNAGELLSRVRNTFEMVASADKDDVLAAAEERLMPKLAAHYDEILLNEELFAKIDLLYNKRGALDLTARQMRLLEKIHNRFVRAGALLNRADKKRLKEINSELSAISVKYGNNILAATNAYMLLLDRDQLDGLPASVRDAAADRAAAAGHAGKWAFTLHKPSWIPFLTYSTKRDLREQIYTAYLKRCDGGDFDNRPLINDFIRLRTEKAHLLGYESYADYVIADEMAGDKKAVYSLLEDIWTPALERASDELEQMQTLFERDFAGETFASWDWWYYAEKLRKRDYSLDEEMLRPYFSSDNVRHGIFFLANRLYGLTFRPVSLPVYNDECSAFMVSDSDDTLLGILYFDLYPRDGKGAGAWCGYYREPTYDENGVRKAPVVGIVCNFPRPVGDTPAQLSTDDVSTLFHEFGHALHFLFSNTTYRGLLDVEGDFVELPSQIMENWAFETDVLNNYATHYRTGDVIPKHLVDKLHRSGLFNQGFATTELVASALSDLDIHSLESYDGEFDVDAFEYDALNDRRGLIPQIEPRYHYPYFSHIFDGGYSAGYYFYIWAEVLDKDAFDAFRQTGDLFDRRTAEKFRREILEKGGSEDGMTMYRAFRGSDPDRTPLLKARGLWNEPEEESAEQE
ncbi:MAG: M3 family metallopeptidase [Alistipes sp.]|nr:M3 family metallopeptidase [Alistipes sp.]